MVDTTMFKKCELSESAMGDVFHYMNMRAVYGQCVKEKVINKE
jgi:hypothetical protein